MIPLPVLRPLFPKMVKSVILWKISQLPIAGTGQQAVSLARGGRRLGTGPPHMVGVNLVPVWGCPVRVESLKENHEEFSLLS